MFFFHHQTRDEAHQKWNLPDYQLPNNGIDDIDIDKHKKFEYTTKTDGRKLWVFDDLFPQETLDHLRSFVLKFGTYYYDDSIDGESDNVQWVAGFRLDPYIKSPYWKIISKVSILNKKTIILHLRIIQFSWVTNCHYSQHFKSFLRT